MPVFYYASMLLPPPHPPFFFFFFAVVCLLMEGHAVGIRSCQEARASSDGRGLHSNGHLTNALKRLKKVSWKDEALSVHAGVREDVCQGTRLDASFSSHYGRRLIGPGGGPGGPRWRFKQRLRVSQHLASSCFTGPPPSRKVSHASPPHAHASLESCMCS